MDLAYSQLRVVLCPLRHYFTIIKTKSVHVLRPSAIGHILHKIYAIGLGKRSFSFVNDAFIESESNKLGIVCTDSIADTVYQNIHTSIFKKLPKNLVIENKLITVTNRLPHINNTITIHNKPDLYYVQGDIATICEIKTGMHNKYDPLQLHFYAWALCMSNSNIRHLVTKVYYTHTNKFEVIDTLTRDEVQERIDRYFDSSIKAYALLNIKNINEVSPTITSLISGDSNKLTKLFYVIHPEQCASCNSSIICPAFLQEVTKTFSNKMLNVPISDMLIQCCN